MIRNVYLDIDDTIFDFNWAEHKGILEAYAEQGISLTEDEYARYHVINQEWWHRSDSGVCTREELLIMRHKQFCTEYGISADIERLEHTYQQRLAVGYRFMPGCRELLQYLRKKYRIYIISNGLCMTQYPRLDEAGIRSWFSGIFISEELGVSKPTPEFFSKIASQISDYLPEETILIGDGLTSDILGGLNAGIHTIWYNYRNVPESREIFPEHVIHDFSEIYQYL